MSKVVFGPSPFDGQFDDNENENSNASSMPPDLKDLMNGMPGVDINSLLGEDLANLLSELGGSTMSISFKKQSLQQNNTPDISLDGLDNIDSSITSDATSASKRDISQVYLDYGTIPVVNPGIDSLVDYFYQNYSENHDIVADQLIELLKESNTSNVSWYDFIYGFNKSAKIITSDDNKHYIIFRLENDLNQYVYVSLINTNESKFILYVPVYNNSFTVNAIKKSSELMPEDINTDYFRNPESKLIESLTAATELAIYETNEYDVHLKDIAEKVMLGVPAPTNDGDFIIRLGDIKVKSDIDEYAAREFLESNCLDKGYLSLYAYVKNISSRNYKDIINMIKDNRLNLEENEGFMNSTVEAGYGSDPNGIYIRIDAGSFGRYSGYIK